MPTLTYLGDEYSCATAIKGADYIHLLNEAGVMIAAFDEIKDFSGFKLTNGSYTSPVADHDCYLVVLRDDGTIGRGGHKCSDIPQTAADVGAVKVYTGLSELGLTESTVTMNSILAKMTVPSRLMVYSSGSWASGVVPETNGILIVEKSHNARVSAIFTSSYANFNCYVGTANGGNTFGGWKKLATTDTALMRDGSNAMSGSLTIDQSAGSKAQVTSYDKRAFLRNLIDGSNYQELKFGADNFVFGGSKGGAPFTHNILHTGNITENGVARIETGSYVGTGTNGVDHPTEITFSFVPKMVWVWRPQGQNSYAPGIGGLGRGYMIPCSALTDQYSPAAYLSNANNRWLNKVVGNTLSFYYGDVATDDETGDIYYPSAYEQLNGSGTTYYYIAIG